MLVSFIISSQGREERIFKTINSLNKQTNTDYEIIIINDDPSIEKESLDFLHDQFEQNEKIILAFNSRVQSAATNWNTGIELATGQYITFIKEGDILDKNFVSSLDKTVNDHSQKLDLIQYKQQWSGLFDGVTKTNLEDEVVYDLTKSKEVYAYINQNVYGKIFRLKYIKDFRITFRRSVRFDTLFLFKALGHARTYYQMEQVLSSHRMGILKYSAFDLVNQWPHILNYYRRIGTFRDLKDELNYAHTYELAFDFLKIVKEFDNKQLYKKALKYAETKMDGKLKSFLKENTIFLKSKDKDFVKYMNDFELFIAKELKSIGR